MEKVYGISFLAQASFVSIVHEGKPVLLGKKIHAVNELPDLAPNSLTSDLDIVQLNSLRCRLLWAHKIIKKTFPDEVLFKCTISHPCWMGFKYKNLLSSEAVECGLLPVSLGGNLDVVGLYADHLLESASEEFWLFVSCDHRDAAASIHAIGEGVVEVLATRYLLDNQQSSDGSTDFDILIENLNDVFKAAGLIPDQISHCILTTHHTRPEEIVGQIAKYLDKGTNSVLHDESSIALGNAIQAGICSGIINDKLLLKSGPNAFVFKIQSDDLVSARYSEGDGDESTLEVNEYHTLVPANYTIPTMRIEEVIISVPTMGAAAIEIYEAYYFFREGMRFLAIGSTGFKNCGQLDTTFSATITIDVDAFHGISSSIKFKIPDQHNVEFTHGYFGFSQNAYERVICSLDEDQNNNKQNEVELGELDCEVNLVINKKKLESDHIRTLVLNDVEKIEVRVPAGVREGSRLRIRGKGNFQPVTGSRGDLYLRIVLTEEEIQEYVLTVGEVEAIARETDIFDGTTAFTKVLGYIRDENAALQSSSRRSNKVISILTTAGSVGAAFAGLTPLAGVLALGRLAANSGSTQKLTWSLKEIDDIKEICDLTQKEIRTVASRFGQPLGRFIHKDDNGFNIYSVFHHQSRGFTLVTLEQAYAHAKCFTDEKTHQLIASVLLDEFQELYNHLLVSLYPSDIFSIKGIRLVKSDIAKSDDPNVEILAHIGDVYRFDYIDGTSIFGYKVPIPVRSDF